MPGIFGLFLAESTEIPPGVARRAVQFLSPTGSDRSGLWQTGHGLLGVGCPVWGEVQGGDLSGVNESGRIHAVCDGRILNQVEIRDRLERTGHEVSGRSDAELLAHLGEGHQGDWELGLRGSFAGAIWDGYEHSLRLLVDHLGTKNLYWLGDKQWVAFASSLPALREMLLEWGREEFSPLLPASLRRWFQNSAWRMDLPVAWSYFEAGSVAAPRTIYQSVFSLPPAGRLTWKAGSEPSVDVWWTPRFQPKRELSVGKAIPGFQETFRETLSLYLEGEERKILPLTADPASLYLNSEASLLNGRKCLVCSCRGEGCSSHEIQILDTAAAALPLEHQVWHLPPPGEGDLVMMVCALSDPVSDPFLWNTFAAIRQAGGSVRSWLSNLGAGEIWEVMPPPVDQSTVGFWRSLFAPEIGLESLPAAQTTRDQRFLQERRVPGALSAGKLRPLQSVAASHSLEVRFPWLDPVLFEWLSRLPVNLKISGHYEYWLLRKALQSGPYTIPPSLLTFAAMPHQPPVDLWLARNLASLFQDLVLDSSCRVGPLFQMTCLRQAFEANRAGVVKLGRHLWAVLMLELWLRENRLAV